jgi:hypothetical protein
VLIIAITAKAAPPKQYYLIGTVPPSLANCSNLESLDLSFNLFIGQIPTEVLLLPVERLSHLTPNQGGGFHIKNSQYGRVYMEGYISYNTAINTARIRGL